MRRLPGDELSLGRGLIRITTVDDLVARVAHQRVVAEKPAKASETKVRTVPVLLRKSRPWKDCAKSAKPLRQAIEQLIKTNS